jgi:hypothetical protein
VLLLANQNSLVEEISKSCTETHVDVFSFSQPLFSRHLASTAALAETPGKHPAYLHARSDLAKARQLMNLPGEEGNVSVQLRNAVEEVNQAIGEIDRAAVLDHKDMDDHPAIDTNLKCLNKFHEIFRLLRSAQKDIDREEDNPASRVWRNRANGEINEAIKFVKKSVLLDEADDIQVR